MRVTLKVCALLTALCVLLPTSAAGQKKAGAEPGELAELNAKIKRFAPTVITADTSQLSAGDRRALAKVVEAARLFDPLFLRQVWSGNVALQRKLEADKTPLGRARLHYFMLNDGPWSQLDENIAFMPGVPHEKPATAAHYPDDMTRQEFESWVARMHTPFLAITQIRALIDGATRDVRAALAIEEGYSFSVPTALLRGRKA